MRLILTCYRIFAYLPAIAYLFYRFFKSRLDIGEIRERLGLYKISSDPNKNIWIHCASVGEVNVLKPILNFLRRKFPDRGIIITTMTVTGREAAKDKYPEIDNIFLAPMDTGFSIKRAIGRINPELIIIIETELWPNLIMYPSEYGVRLVLINARISPSSFKWYLFLSFFFREILNRFDLIIAQSEEDRKRFEILKGNSKNIYVTGNLKFDIEFPEKTKRFDDVFSNILQGKPVFVAGSTHEGEEEIILHQIPRFLENFPDLKFIIAPRHLERIQAVERLMLEHGIRYIKRTEIETLSLDNINVILLDTIGELSRLYEKATVVFIGGTLVPVGGHNVIEPAIYSKPVIFGPYYSNFKYACKLLLEEGGGICVKNGEELFEKTSELLKNQNIIESVGKRAYNAVKKGMGSAERTMSLIETIIN